VPLSKPMQLMTLRLDPDDKRKLERMAREQHITLSHALREGAKLYLAEKRAAGVDRQLAGIE
jgi:predicted transcriptional regulator